MKFSDIFTKESNELFGFEKLGFEHRAFSEAAIQISNSKSLTQNIRSYFLKKEVFSEKIGSHPDFEVIDANGEYHYIVSVFADIQGSTNLIFNYSLEQVRFIKDNIISAAIEIFQALDGHIHRLQGDAIFCYFGGKNIKISDAVINALNASTLLQEYINGYINPQFLERNIKPIKIRIGIDLGYENEVLWSKYGLKECTEITTTSLHTDLASKMQSRCPANSIMIGEQVYQHIDIPEELLKVKTFIENYETKEDKYIINRKDYRYKMFIFEWEKYLKSFEFYFGNDELDQYSLACHYLVNGEYKKYVSNSFALPKQVPLKFFITGLDNLNNYDFIWTVINHGKEATEGEAAVPFEMEKFRGNIQCEQETAFLGHHYMKCTIIKDNSVVGQKYFGIYVDKD